MFPPEDRRFRSSVHIEISLPENWEANQQYLFHLDQDMDFEELATVVFPARLRSVGAVVLDAPSS